MDQNRGFAVIAARIRRSRDKGQGTNMIRLLTGWRHGVLLCDMSTNTRRKERFLWEQIGGDRSVRVLTEEDYGHRSVEISMEIK